MVADVQFLREHGVSKMVRLPTVDLTKAYPDVDEYLFLIRPQLSLVNDVIEAIRCVSVMCVSVMYVSVMYVSVMYVCEVCGGVGGVFTVVLEMNQTLCSIKHMHMHFVIGVLVYVCVCQ